MQALLDSDCVRVTLLGLTIYAFKQPLLEIEHYYARNRLG
jgi:hypothetical protein